MAKWKTIDHIEKIEPEGVEECGLAKAPYYVIHYEDGTSEEADFISEHDEEDFDSEEDEGYEPKTHEEVLAEWDAMLKELKLSLEGKIKLKTWEEAMADWDNIDADD